MEKKELRKKIEELDIKRKVSEMKGDVVNYDTDNQYHYISEEDILELLDKAKEEGIKMGMENAWGMVSSLLDTLDIDKNEEEIKVLVGVNKLFDTEITKLALNLKTKEDGK